MRKICLGIENKKLAVEKMLLQMLQNNMQNLYYSSDIHNKRETEK